MNFGLLSSFSISLGDLELATDYVNNEDSNLSSEVDTIKQTVFNKPATKKSKRAIIKPEITHEKLMKKFSIIKPEALNIDSELIEDTTDISLEDVGDFTFSFEAPEPEKDKIDKILEASDDEDETYEDEPYVDEDEDNDIDNDKDEDELNLDNILDEDDDIDNEDDEPDEVSDESRGLAALQLQQMLKTQQNSPPAQEETEEDELNLDNILDEDDDIDTDEDESDNEDEESPNLDNILNEDEDDEDEDEDEDLSAFLKQVNTVNTIKQTDNKINKTVTELPKQQEEVKQSQVNNVEAVNVNNSSTKEKELELEAEKLRLEREKLELENKKLELEKLKAEQELARFKDMDIQEIIRKAQEEALKKLKESQAENKESNIKKEIKENINSEQKIEKPIQEKVENKAEVTKPKQVVKKEVTPIKSHNIVDNIDDEIGKVKTARHIQEIHQENKNPYAIYDNMAMDSLSATVKKYMIANGVKLKPISEETLNNKFGKNNIKKLIRASYLISTGKGITMGI